MSPKPEEPRRPDRKRARQREREAGLLEAAARDNVMLAPGGPPPPHRARVRRVWGACYRVNVFVGAGAASLRVAHSFFLRADGDGKALASSPAITRLYERRRPRGRPVALERQVCYDSDSRGEGPMRKDKSPGGWVVYLMAVPGKPGEVRAVCEQEEWDEMQRRQPGHHKLLREGIASEAEAEALARAGVVAAELAKLREKKRARRG
jgi:hypothetical protein